MWAYEVLKQLQGRTSNHFSMCQSGKVQSQGGACPTMHRVDSQHFGAQTPPTRCAASAFQILLHLFWPSLAKCELTKFWSSCREGRPITSACARAEKSRVREVHIYIYTCNSTFAKSMNLCNFAIYIYIHIFIQYICIWSWAPVRSWPSQCQAWSCCFTTLFSTVAACYGRLGVSEKVRYVHENGDESVDLGVSENSVPLNPMVNDHYPY